MKLAKNIIGNAIATPFGGLERIGHMRKRLVLFTVSALLCIGLSAFADVIASGGTVTVAGKTVTPGQSFFVDITLNGGDITITSLRIPLVVSHSDITCTGVDFSGALVPAGMEAGYIINGNYIDIFYTPHLSASPAVISAASGKLATLNFATAATFTDKDIAINAVNIDNSFMRGGTLFHRWDRVELTDNSGLNVMLPTFVSGTVALRNSTDIGDDNGNLPGEFALGQNYPNPFNPTTSIAFTLPERARVRLDVYNLLGQKVAVLADGDFGAGEHIVQWEAKGIPSGVYFYRLSTENKAVSRKMTLLK